MRKSIIFALGLMLGVFGMTGCSKDAANEQINGGVEEFTLISHADAPDTRMVINGDKANGFKTAWEDGDQIGVYATDYVDGDKSNSTLYTCNYYHTATIGSDGKATFTGTIRKTSSNTFNLFAYYPYTAGSDYNDTDYQTGVNCSLASVQTMNGNSFDKSCSYMVAKTGLTVATSSQQNSYEVGNWQFRHTVAFINLGIKAITNSVVSGDEIVKSATIHATDKTLAGDFQFNLENGEMTFTSSKDIVVVNVPADTKLSDLSAWFVVNPFELTANDELEIVITTKTHIITKKVSVAKSFEAANVYTLNLTIDDKCTVADAPQEPEVVVKWTRVTSLSEITEGEYVIASLNDSSYGYLPTTSTSSAPKCTETSSVSEDGTELTSVADDMIWTFSGTTSAMTIKNGTNYLSAGASNNSVRVNTTTTKWAITTVKDGFNFKSGDRYLSVYSGQDWRCYTTNTTNNCNIVLFKKSTITTGPSIGVSDIANVSARGVEKEIAEYTTVNFADNTDDVNASVGANSDFITLGDVEAGMLEYTIAANYSDAQRTGTIVLTSAKNNVSATITVTQNAATFAASRTEFALGAKNGKDTSVTITSDFDWTIKGIAADAKFKVTPQAFEYKNDAKQTITITASEDNKSAEEITLGSFKIVRVEDEKEIVLTVKQSANLLDNPTITYLAMQTNTLKAEWSAVANADSYTWHLYKGAEMNEDNIVGMGDVTTNSLNITLPNGDIDGDKFEAGVDYSLWIQSVASDNSDYVTPDTWSAPKIAQISTEKKITVNATALSVLATGVSNATFDVKLDNLVASDVTVTYDGTVVSAAKWNDAGTQVVYTVGVNSGAAREGSITLTADGVTPIVITVSQFAYSAPATYTLTFPDGNSKKVQNYTSTWSATIDNNTWSISKFNNNNSGWTYIRCGSKNEASVASITTDWAIEEAITKVTVTIDAITTSSVNSIKLQVASDKDFKTVIGTYNVDMSSKGVKEITITTPTANCYYKLVFDCKKSSNGVVQVSKVVYTNE